MDLDAVAKEYCDCQRCGLGQLRKKFVFGSGPSDAKVMLVGEAPGREEDEGGEPFVGAAGKLLDELLDLAGIRRDEIYIANVLKCRPPKNRDPKPSEIMLCGKILKKQIVTINPEVIVALGNFAARYVLSDPTIGITSFRGTVCHTPKGRLVLPTYHPAAALYDETKLPDLKEDFVMLGELMKEESTA